MTNRESKLLAQWPEHRRRGRILFILLRGVLPFSGVLIGILLYWGNLAISPRHFIDWGGFALLHTRAMKRGHETRANAHKYGILLTSDVPQIMRGYVAIAMLAAGGFRGAFLWNKMESIYANLQRRS